ncbi:gamma-glutamyl hydrolase-like [Mustelus asterias]
MDLPDVKSVFMYFVTFILIFMFAKGVLAVETGEAFKQFGKSYIPASYVKFLESAGARVAPIRLVYALHSRMFKNFPKYLLQALQVKPLAGHYHNWSISVKSFTDNKNLTNFYKILTTNMDSEQVEFVSTMEAFRYLIYAFQWHPERSPYEWNATWDIPHSSEAVQVAWYLADLFVNEARENSCHFSNTMEEEKALIYNYPPIYSGNISKFEQIHLID